MNKNFGSHFLAVGALTAAVEPAVPPVPGRESVRATTLANGLKIDDLLWKGSLGAGVSPAREQWRIESPTKMQLVWKDFEPRTEPERRGFRIARPTHADKE